MTYGESKRKDMIESILPSRRRKYARSAKAEGIRRGRHRTKEALRRDPDEAILDIDYDNVEYDFVMDRRNADNSAALTRWVTHKAVHDPEFRGLDKEAQLAKFRAMMPDTTIGRHAADHAKWAIEGVHKHESWPEYHRRRAEKRRRANQSAHDRLVNDLRMICDAHLKAFNHAIKQINNNTPRTWNGTYWVYAKSIPRLEGYHDIERWITDTHVVRRHLDALDVVKRVVVAIEKWNNPYLWKEV